MATTTTPEIPAAEPDDESPAIFEMVAALETDIHDISNHAEIVYLIGDGLGDKQIGRAIQQLGIDLRDAAERLKEAYTELFHAAHSQEATHG
jgi:uncharacterized hydantoinase/oxoprolinase family protein